MDSFPGTNGTNSNGVRPHQANRGEVFGSFHPHNNPAMGYYCLMSWGVGTLRLREVRDNSNRFVGPKAHVLNLPSGGLPPTQGSHSHRGQGPLPGG